MTPIGIKRRALPLGGFERLILATLIFLIGLCTIVRCYDIREEKRTRTFTPEGRDARQDNPLH